jgi:phasin
MAGKQDPQAANFEIPPAFRQMVEQSIDQSRHAYNQLLDATRNAQSMVARSGDVMSSGARAINERIMQYTAQNLEANFAHARELARVHDFKEMLEVQQNFAQRQMATYATQAQELTRLMAEAAQRAQSKP